MSLPEPLLVFDGDCAFCSSCVRAAERWLPGGWAARPWQFTELAELGLTEERAQREVLWVTPAGEVYGGAQAAAKLLLRAGGGWAYLGGVLRLAPVRPVAGLVYRWVSRNRHRMPGGTAACALPRRG
ncbi:thiol-disulfide oxidoreductase DCC family protein [Kitasatospora sp. NPDC006697]|uniref:thiol-disulfide oxidoreductase DCC family protein n=1 Tax=Kitasatospora sp. NPDC006697 TaxID=3364020 RepID=UPI0036A95190